MPIFLCKDSIRLLEASVSSLNLALIGLSLPLRSGLRETNALYASEVGLIGAAAEQAINACMTQNYGFKGLLTADGKFKSASQVFDEFIALLKRDNAKNSFLVKGVPDPEKHLRELIDKTSKFRILAKSRAGGFHAGFGPSREVAVILANDVSEFLFLLSKSSRIKPYLSFIPKPHDITKDRATLIEELANQVNASNVPQEKSVLISSAFLILPELNDVKPEWLDAFERVSVTPTASDIVLLLDALNRAVPTTLIRATGSGDAFPVRIDQQNPAALSVSPQFLRREFNQINDQWFADVGIANGRLKQKVVDLPHPDFILDIFGVGLDKLNIGENKLGIPAQQTWPFISASLGVQGTSLPYWFLVRKTEDLNELTAYLKRVEKFSNGYFRKKIIEFFEGVVSIKNNEPLLEGSVLLDDMLALAERIDDRQSRLHEFFEQNKTKDSVETNTIIEQTVNEEIDISTAITAIMNMGEIEPSRKIYWIRTLAECCREIDDIPGLLYALKNEQNSSIKTAVRKGLRLIDFLYHGPDFI